MKIYKLILVATVALLFEASNTYGQAQISQDTQLIKTYLFSNPSPMPYWSKNASIYPYHKFKDYENKSSVEEWEVVTLENDYIKVFILPQIGGKVWGAIEKSTGEEFIYKNGVVKFRNVALRGPWTSGGIEFNFGIIGHSPATATPVDYKTAIHDDGSVSCTVGAMDLPSRTQWRVEIKLAKDKAYFETNIKWYNPTATSQANYSWSTAAAVARNDLEFIYPGNQYLKHSGASSPWPTNKASKNLSWYRENAFGGDKSYHIVGSLNDFFGGYYHEKAFGFGHWSAYEEMPGQKLWLWSHFRDGAIWEDLLTDDDGQYVEFQAGRLLNQYSIGIDQNPIKEAVFLPGSYDAWSELWFPIKEIGGATSSLRSAVFNVEVMDSKSIQVGINALEVINDTIRIAQGGRELYKKWLQLNPMDVLVINVPEVLGKENVNIVLGDESFDYSTFADPQQIKRPFHRNDSIQISKEEEALNAAFEALHSRKINMALEGFEKANQSEHYKRKTWLGLAETYYKQGLYEKGLQYCIALLQLDTYDSDANYLAGITYLALEDQVNALESLGWAARSPKYASVAFQQMAELYLSMKMISKASIYSKKGLQFNQNNINALVVQAILFSSSGQKDSAQEVFKKILEIDPLHHLTLYELGRMNSKKEANEIIKQLSKNEFDEEDCIEAAFHYLRLGQLDRALELLSVHNQPKSMILKAYLMRDEDPERSKVMMEDVAKMEPNFVFHYRLETLPVLQWSITQSSSWKFNFYLGLNLYSVGRNEEAKRLFLKSKNESDYWVFYLTRAQYFQDEKDKWNDLLMAQKYGDGEFEIIEQLIYFHLNKDQVKKAYETALNAYQKGIKNPDIELIMALCALEYGKYVESADVLDKINVLPSEHSKMGRFLYENAHLSIAIEQIKKGNHNKARKEIEKSLLWPENIGAGKPVNTDDRKQLMLKAILDKSEGNDNWKQVLTKVAEGMNDGIVGDEPNDALSLHALNLLGKTDTVEIILNENNNTEWVKSVIDKNSKGKKDENLIQKMIRTIVLLSE